MELITGSYKALEEEFLKYLSGIKKEPLEKVLIITQSQRLNQRLKERLLTSKECLSCVFWQDILGLVSNINQSGENYLPLKQKSALDYFKLKDFLAKNNFNFYAGYIQALQSSFMDMQNALIMPQDLLKIEELNPSLSSKELKDLIFIYKNYLKLTEQEGKINYKDFFISALDNVEKNNYLSQFKQIIFYGIYDLTSLQYDILKAVGQNYPTTLFFPYENVPGYKYIQDFYLTNIIGIGAKHKKLALPKSNLEEFSDHLFEADTTQSSKYQADIKIVDTSGFLDQIKSAAKEVLLLRKQGVDFKDMAVCARSLEPYKNDIAQIFLHNDIPININLEESFLTKPLVNVCINLLNIARNNFHKDSVLSFITSPYLKNKQPFWGQLIKDIGVQTGFKQWMNLLDLAIDKKQKGAKTLKDFLINLEQKVSILEGALSFNFLAEQVKEILNTFIDFKNLNSEEEKLFEIFDNILREIVSFDKVRPAQKGEFLDELLHFVEQEKVNFVVNLQNSLTIADIMNLRGQSFKAIIILGLNEGVFPARISEDPVFKDIWRAALQKLGYGIRVSAQRYQEEKMFFYFAISCAEQKAILIYQRCDEEGKIKIPSVYLNWVLKILEGGKFFSLSKRPCEQLLQWHKLAPDLLTPSEAALLSALEGNYILAAELSNNNDLDLFTQAYALSLQGALGARDLVCKPKGPLWQHILKEGLSPTSVKDLFQCPAKYLFNVIFDKEDITLLQRDKLDQRERGILFHRILEQFYKYLAQRKLFDKVFAGGALDILQGFIDQNIKQEDYKKYGLYPLLWTVFSKEMEESLRTFVKEDLTRIQNEKQVPSYFETDISCNLDNFKIHGKIDRVDVSCDKGTFNVIDYKSGKISGKTNKIIFEEANAQGPFYFELAKTMDTLKDLTADKMIYASLKDNTFKDISYQEYSGFRETFWSLVRSLRELVEEGTFIITSFEKACQYCPYGEICRKNHQTSKKRAYFSKQAGKLREYRAK